MQVKRDEIKVEARNSFVEYDLSVFVVNKDINEQKIKESLENCRTAIDILDILENMAISRLIIVKQIDYIRTI